MNRLRGVVRSRLFQGTAAAVLLAALYAAADWRAVGRVLLALDARYLIAALLLFLPQTMLSAWRWRLLVRPVRAISFRDALRHNLAAAALNLVVPSKLGDLGRVAFLPEMAPRDRFAAARRAVLEKALDVTALGALLAWGWCGGDAAGWGVALGVTAAALLLVARRMSLRLAAFLHEYRPPVGRPGSSTAQGSIECGRWFTRRRAGPAAGELAAVAWLALLLWTLHLWQIDLFLRAAGVFVASGEALARLPLAILAGLLPLSFCGVGTRDAALVGLFAHVAAAPPLAAAGLLTSLRYLIPGACGVPCLLTLRRRERSEPARGITMVLPGAAEFSPTNATAREEFPAGWRISAARDGAADYVSCGSADLRRAGFAELHSLVSVSNTSGDS